MLSARAVPALLLVPVAFGAGLLLAGGDEPRADAEPASAVKAIDVGERSVDIPGVTAVRLPSLREEPKADRPTGPASTGSSSAAQQPVTPTPSTSGSAPAAPTGGSGSSSESTPQPDTGSTGGSAEEGSTGS